MNPIIRTASLLIAIGLVATLALDAVRTMLPQASESRVAAAEADASPDEGSADPSDDDGSSDDSGATDSDGDDLDHDSGDARLAGVVLSAAADERYAKFPGTRLAKAPAVVARTALAAKIDALVAAKALAKAQVSICVVAASDGAVLYQRGADEPRIVASNDKLFTTAAALDVLGVDFRFRTTVYARGEVTNGELKGDLVVIGDGDPDVLPAVPSEKASLAGRLGAALAAAGLKRVTGDLVIDDHVFDRQYRPPQWTKQQLPHDYAAPVAGFSLYENCLVVRVTPGSKLGAKAAVSVLPNSPLLTPTVDLTTGGAKAKNAIHVPAPVAVEKVKVGGTTPLGSSPVPIFLPLADPGATHPDALKAAFARAGVAIGGRASLAAAKVDPTGLRELAVIETPLTSVLEKLNKESSNVLAEHVYKRTGAKRFGVGSVANGGKAVLETLSKHQIAITGAASADGSGLSRGNLFTARQTASLLRVMWQGKGRESVVRSLPISGVDGTLAKRLTQDAYKGRVRAKTGYIAAVSALSGYAATDAGDVVCFSILVNGVKGATAAKALQDGVAKLLCDLGPAKP